MSSNRLSYDTCAYKQNLQQSTEPLDYMLYTGKYQNCAKCRIEFGTVGGNGVSIYTGNLVDLESNLRGQTRPATLCSKCKFHPTPQNTNPPLAHQPSCQMQYYPRVPLPKPSKVSGCDYSNVNK